MFSLLLGGCFSFGSIISEETTPCAVFQQTPMASLGELDISFSKERGFFSSSFKLSLKSEIEGELYYTTDGAIPTPETGTEYDESIRISTTTIVRAAVYNGCVRNSEIITHSYFFLEDVLEQNEDDVPNHQEWGHSGPDWEMDPRIIDANEMPDEKESIFQTLPTFSVSMDWNNWFGTNGIYLAGENIEKEVSVEYLSLDKEGFAVRSHIEIFGNTSVRRWKVDKLSFRLTFRDETGYSKLNYKLFNDSPLESFQRIILDAAHNNTFFAVSEAQRKRAHYARDQFAADLHNAIGGYAPHGNYAHLYLNGIYWGMYYIHERPDHDFAEAYLGGDDNDYNVIKHKMVNIVSGSNESFQELWRRAEKDLSDDDNYEAVTELLDIDQYIKYILVHLYIGNNDWGTNNWYATQHKRGKWRFHTWDAEHVMEHSQTNNFKRLHYSDMGFHKHLMFNEEYREHFMEVVNKEFYEDGLFTEDIASSMLIKRAEEIETAIIAESARWGDNKTPEEPRTQWDHWKDTQNYLLKIWFPRRTNNILEQIEWEVEHYKTGLLPREEREELYESSSSESSSSSSPQ
ncbi:MAG: CotH kinase family protein [Fibrobacterales bacterium]